MGEITFGKLLGALIKELREAGGYTQIELADESFGIEAKGKERRIREIENGDVPTPRAATYMPLCETLNIDRARIRDLKAQAANAKEQEDEEFDEVSEKYGSSAATFDAVPTLNRDELELLAGRFDIEQPHLMADSALRQQLTYKAEEYRALKAEVDTINEDMKRLANLKAAAQDAIARVDLDEVERLLEMVQETELEEAAKTAELRANNALLRDKVAQAFQLLESAANSFGAISAQAIAERKILRYFKTLRGHGLRYGGQGLALSEQLIAPELTNALKSTNPWLWAAGKNWQGVALQNQGVRSEGSAATTLLAQAVTAYGKALEVCTRAAHPVDWAMTQNNLGITLKNQGNRSEGRAATTLLAQAITAYGNALEVYTRADHPVDWAMTQNNLGIALQDQGIRSEGSAATKLLAQAVTAYRKALEVRTRAEHPVQWAMTQNNLGNALQVQGKRSKGSAATELLAQAVTAYRKAFEVRTRPDHPVDWAMTQFNIALAMLETSRHDATTDPHGALQAALQAVDDALTVYDPDHMPYHHAKATRLRDKILAGRTALD